MKKREARQNMRNQFRNTLLFTDRLAAVFFFCGILAGCVWVHTGNGEALFLGTPSFFLKQTTGEALLSLMRSRILLLFGLWILGLSLLAVPGICLFFCWSGFSMAAVLAGFTAKWGAKALFLFLFSLFPHLFLYLPILFVLSSWAFGKRKKLHLSGFLILLIATVLGAVLEGLVNPLFCLLFSCYFV